MISKRKTLDMGSSLKKCDREFLQLYDKQLYELKVEIKELESTLDMMKDSLRPPDVTDKVEQFIEDFSYQGNSSMQNLRAEHAKELANFRESCCRQLLRLDRHFRYQRFWASKFSVLPERAVRMYMYSYFLRIVERHPMVSDGGFLVLGAVYEK